MTMNLSREQWNGLVALTLARDEQACGELADALGGLIRALFRKRGLPTSDAEDLAVSCVSDIILELDSFKPERGTSFKSWVYGIAMHRRADYFRLRSGRADRRLDSDPASPVSDNHATELESTVDLRRQAVDDALMQLSASERRIIEARLGREPVTFELLASEMGVSAATCRKRHERVLRKLRIWLAADPRASPIRKETGVTSAVTRMSPVSNRRVDE